LKSTSTHIFQQLPLTQSTPQSDKSKFDIYLNVKMGIGTKIADTFRKDPNWTRLGYGIVLGAKGVRAGAGRYFSNKVPVVQWITAYSPKWILGDVIAGQSVGMLLLPQALMYSSIAGIPIQQALLASWIPGLIYAIMGTSRGTINF
jgi:sodium-independent sulfate anion transporter 11